MKVASSSPNYMKNIDDLSLVLDKKKIPFTPEEGWALVTDSMKVKGTRKNVC